MSTMPYYRLERFTEFPTAYVPSKTFMKFVSSYLPPIYFDSGKSLSKKYGVKFTEMWAWESSNLLRELNINERPSNAQGFAYQRFEYSIPSVSFRVSEAYRTAFMRTLAWLRQLGKIPQSTFVRESLRTCPTDLSFWDMESKDLPTWWPELPEELTKSESEAKTPVLVDFQTVKNLVEEKTDSFGEGLGIIVAADGPMVPKSGVGSLVARFSIIGFAYRVRGKHLPRNEEVSYSVAWRSNWYVNPESIFSIKILEAIQTGNLVCVDADWTLGDLEIIPLVSLFSIPTINIWQWFRGYDPPFGLSPFLCGKTVKAHRGKDELSYESEGMPVAVCYDWRIGTLERHEDFAYPLHGRVVEARSDWIRTIIEDRNVRFAYALTTTTKFRPNSYTEPKEHKQSELLNLGRVISNSES